MPSASATTSAEKLRCNCAALEQGNGSVSNVIEFRQSHLSPFLGEWLLDPISVSRNKVMKRVLGEDGLKQLWACASIQERTQCLAVDRDLTDRYQAAIRLAGDSRMVVTPETVPFHRARGAAVPAKTSVYTITRVTTEGRKVTAHTVDTCTERRSHPVGYVFRMSKQWLLVSEQYYGREATYFPRSPVHRYYAAT